MSKSTLAVKMDVKVLERVRRHCEARGIKQGFFVEKALTGQMERDELSEDLLDFRERKTEESASVSFEDYLRLRHA